MSNYVWTVTNGTIEENINPYTTLVCWDNVPYATPGYLKVVYTDENGCRADNEDKLTVTIRPLPAKPEIAGNKTICINIPETFNFVPQTDFSMINYKWTVTGGAILGGGDGTDQITVSWDKYGVYRLTLEVTSEFGCVSPVIGELDVEVKGAYATITGPKELCLDFIPVQYFTQNSMTNYAWSITGGTINSGANSNPVTLTWNNDGIGILSVTYTDANGCRTYMTEPFKSEIIICKVIDCELSENRIETEDDVKVGYYTLLDDRWDFITKAGFSFDSVQYYINDVLYSHGTTASLSGAQFPTRVNSTVRGIAFFNDIPDTCEFNVYINMACPKSVDDIEENRYTVIPLAGLCWTTNIASTLYSSDGSAIAFANPYFSRMFPDIIANKDTFGLLYTWYSTVGLSQENPVELSGDFIQGICPDEFHVPSIAEWSLLKIYDAKKLKSEQQWIVPGTNETEFNALPAGMYNATAGRYVKLYSATAYWSVDEGATQATALYFSLEYYCNVAQIFDLRKIDAISVRCVMVY
jgi:uncharacterized protein (TIGR02145 family)